MKNHFISKDKTLIEALTTINSLVPDPLVLFVLDENDRMVGTLTDGDSRRALIAHASVNDKIEKVMHRNFNYMFLMQICTLLKSLTWRSMQLVCQLMQC